LRTGGIHHSHKSEGTNYTEERSWFHGDSGLLWSLRSARHHILKQLEDAP
jgi:hypothetical protein